MDGLRNIDVGIIVVILSSVGWGIQTLFSFKARLSAHEERIEKTEQECAEATKGRRELHHKIDDQQRDMSNALQHLEDTIGGRLDKILEILSESQSRQATLESRVDTIDERGTRHFQDFTQRNNEKK